MTGPLLSDAEIEAITQRLTDRQPLDEQYRHALFQQGKDAEIVYADKEPTGSVLARTMAVPFQTLREFGDPNAEWTNKLIFGENLQVRKTLLEMKRRRVLGRTGVHEKAASS